MPKKSRKQVAAETAIWSAGYHKGSLDSAERIEELKQKIEKLEKGKEAQELQALERITQSGALVVECMSRALISVKGKQ